MIGIERCRVCGESVGHGETRGDVCLECRVSIVRSPLYYLKKKIELGRDKKAVLMYDLRAINQESDQCRKRNGGGRNGKYQNQQA